MVLKVADRIKQTTTSTGTGDISFTGTPVGFASFGSVLSDGDVTYYAIEENDKWEVGIGTYGSDNMVRSHILASSNSDNAVNLGGSGVVFITYPADKGVFKNQESQLVVGPSGLIFNDGTTIVDNSAAIYASGNSLTNASDIVGVSGIAAYVSGQWVSLKLIDLSDVNASGAVTSSHLLSFNTPNKSLLLGDITGPSNESNTLIGYGAASGTTGSNIVSLGTQSSIANANGSQNVSIGTLSGPSEPEYRSSASNTVSVGYKAGSRMRNDSTAIGHQAGIAAYELGFVAVGSTAGSGIGSYSVAVGYESAHGVNSDYIVAVGHQAGKSSIGDSCVWVGNMAGSSASAATKSIGIGYQAGKSSSADDSVYIGQSAGQNNSSDNYLYIANGAPASNRTLIKGDMQSKRLAVGSADVTLEDTLYIGIATSTDKGLVVKSATAQSALLTDWQTSLGGSVASLSAKGDMTVNKLSVSGQGITIDSHSSFPTSVTNTLSNVEGTLFWRTLPVTAPTGANQKVAFYNSANAAIYHNDLSFDSGNIILGVGNVNLGKNRIDIQDPANRVVVGRYPDDDGITESNSLTFVGPSAGINASGAHNTSAFGSYAGYGILNSEKSVVMGYSAGINASGERATYIGDEAGAAATGVYNTFIGANAGKKCVGSQNLEIVASGNDSFSPLNGYSNKIHISQTIIGDTDARKLAFGLVSSSNINPDATVEIFPKTDDLALKVHGSGEFASGIALPSAVPASTTNMLYNDAGTLKFSGSTIGGGDVTTAELTYVSGIAVYASGHVHDDLYVSGVANYASGVVTGGTPTFGDMYVDQYIYHNGDNDTYIRLRGDQFDFVAGGRTMLTLDEAGSDIVTVNDGANDVDFQVKGDSDTNLIRTDAANDLVGIGTSSPSYKLDVVGHDAWVRASGVIVGNSGVVLANNAPAVTTNTLYNDGGTLKFNGSTIGGGDVTTAELTYVSGIAVYASGQAIANETDIVATSGIANYASGLAITNEANVAYASGNTANISFGSNVEGDILYHDGTSFTRLAKGTDSHVLTMDGNVPAWEAATGGGGDVTTAQLSYVSGIAVYASGHVHDDIYVSGIAAYASGQAIANESDIATNVTNIATNATNIVATSGIANYASGLAITNEANVAYASGQAIANETDIATNADDIVGVSGIANYASGLAITNEANVAYASGNTANIAFGSNAEGDILYHNGTSFTRLAKGTDNHVLTMDGNAPNWEAAAGGGSANASGAIYQVQYNADGANFGGDAGFTWTTDGQGGAFTNDHVLAVSGTIIANSGDANYANPVSIGSGAVASATAAIAIGHESTADAQRAIAIGDGSHADNNSSIGIGRDADAVGSYSVAIGRSADADSYGIAMGYAPEAKTRGVGIGSNAYAGNHAVALGEGAKAPDGGFVLASGSALSDVLLSGVMKTHLTMPNGQQFRQMASAAQTTDLMQWQNSAGTNVAAMTPSGVLNVYDIRTSGEQVQLGIGADAVWYAGKAGAISIGKDSRSSERSVTIGLESSTTMTTRSYPQVAIGYNATAVNAKAAVVIGANARVDGERGIAVGYDADADGYEGVAIGYTASADERWSTSIGGRANANAYGSVAVGARADSSDGEFSVALGYRAVSTDQTWVIASGNAATDVGVSGVFGSYAAFPNGEKLAIGGNVPTYTVDALGHGAMVRGTGVIVGNSGIVLANNAPSVTTNTLYNDGGTLKFNGSTIGGGGGISWDGSTANGVATYKDGDEATVESNLTFTGSALTCIGTITVGVDDTGHDVKFFGATSGSYLEWDENVDTLNLIGAAYVQEAVPANDTPTAEDATVTLDLRKGNYHNISLGNDVTKFEFTNAKRGQKFILRITQHDSSAKTVSWSDVDSDTGGTAATVRWAGGITPTMSTATEHTDVYGFLCTNDAGTAFDGFIIGQDLPD